MPLGASRLSFLAFQAAVEDAGRDPVTVTAAGSTQVDTARSQFGGASALFDGSADYLYFTGDSWDLSGDFTIETWVYQTYQGSNQKVFDFRGITGSNPGADTSVGLGGTLLIDVNPSGDFRCFIDGSDRSTSGTGTIPINTWTHIAVQRKNGSLNAWVDGTRYVNYSGSDDYSSVFAVNQPIGASGEQTGAMSGWEGSMDEIRFSSTARYNSGSSITVPTSAFTNDGDTLMLLHCNGTDGSTTFTDDNVDPFATGGFTTELTVSGTNYRFHVFDSDSTDDFVASGAGTVDVMLIGGGGGGLGGQFTLQAGGGAGKVLLNSGVSVSGQSYTITAGTGATGGTQNATISDGGTTSAFGYTAIGGDSVSPVGTYNAQNGGDSGNGYTGGTGFDYSGYNSWDAGGGGAGATSNGSNAVSSSSPTSTNGTGGNGYDLTSFIGSGNTLNLRSSNLIPSSLIVAEGGNGARSTSADSTSFGSGSDGLYDTTIGGNGKSGAVIIRYAI